MNLTFGYRVGENCVEGPGGIWSEIAEDNVFELEDAWILVRLVGFDDQLRVIADDLIDPDFYLVAVTLLRDCI